MSNLKSLTLFFLLANFCQAHAEIFCLQAVSAPVSLKSKSKKKKMLVLKDDPTTPWTNHVTNSAFDRQGFVKANSRFSVKVEQEMYYRVDYPKHPKNVEDILLIHGLGDHSGRLNQLAEKYLAEGHRVIRVDLLGHGRSLWRGLQNKSNVDETIDIRAHALSVIKILTETKVSKVKIIGHSLGGAVGLITGAMLKDYYPKSKIEIEGLNLISFYAQDIAEWYSSQALVGRPVTDSIAKGIKFFAPEVVSNKLESNLEQSNFIFGQFFSSIDAVFRFLGFSSLKESLTDPKLEKFMYSSYEPYFRFYAEKSGIDLNDPAVKESLDQQIRSAIAVTRGARKFNLFHPSESMPHTNIPIQIIIGTHDELVPMGMMKQAAIRLEEKGFVVDFVEISEAGHLVTRTHPDQVFEQLKKAPQKRMVQ